MARLVHRLIGDAPHEQVVSTFDMAMTLVAAGYGIAIAPATRLAGYQCRGIAARPLAGAPPIVMAYLLHTCVPDRTPGAIRAPRPLRFRYPSRFHQVFGGIGRDGVLRTRRCTLRHTHRNVGVLGIVRQRCFAPRSDARPGSGSSD